MSAQEKKNSSSSRGAQKLSSPRRDVQSICHLTDTSSFSHQSREDAGYNWLSSASQGLLFQVPERVSIGHKPQSPDYRLHLTLPWLCRHTHTPVSRHLVVRSIHLKLRRVESDSSRMTLQGCRDQHHTLSAPSTTFCSGL